MKETKTVRIFESYFSLNSEIYYIYVLGAQALIVNTA